MVWVDMEIKDIIKSDSDRLFIVDPECYIIFTGETTNDIKPFIRIGNWNDMPVELIPLIENIIITDSLIGNPALEQFNIDVRHLPENRYIGSKSVVRKFLDYQKIFGLDLTNASVVDIEKDLPELSKAKNISHKDQFIGVFYRDGNFKVLLDKNTIFDLNRIIEQPISWQKFHDTLSETYRNTGRYDGAGLVVIGHNPFFYNRKQFYPYLFPGDYLGDFSLLGIDPGKIQAIMHPSLNLMNLSKLFKWLNNTRRKIRLFVNSTDIELVKRLFSQATIRNEAFSSLDVRTDTGLVIRNFPGTYNLKLAYDAIATGGEGLTAAFIKGAAGVRDIIREKLDLIIITYTAYEDIHMLLKSTDTPCIIIDDGNRNAAKLSGSDRIVLHPGIHYEFRSFAASDEIIPLTGLPADTVARAATDPASLAAELAAPDDGVAGPDRMREMHNLMTLVRMNLYSTRDRRLSAQLRSLAESLSLKIARGGAIIDQARHRVVLALHNNTVFPFIIESGSQPGGRLFDRINSDDPETQKPESAGMRDYFERIIRDRERLRYLIDIYTQSERYREKNAPDLGKLREAIGERKEQYRDEALSLDERWSRSIASTAAAVSGIEADGAASARSGAGTSRTRRKLHPDDDLQLELGMEAAQDGQAAESAGGAATAGPAGGLISRIRSLPKAVTIGIPIGLVLIIAALFIYHGRITGAGGSAAGSKRIAAIKPKGPVVQSRDIDTRYRQLGTQLNIRIKDHDIYRYANEVAVKNGYHRIAETKLRERNPDWIYPENVFIMLDFQPVVVSKGDTLWNLSKNKLIESTIKINEFTKQFATADIPTKKRLVKEMRHYAFTDEQKELFRKAEASLPAVKQQVPGK